MAARLRSWREACHFSDWSLRQTKRACLLLSDGRPAVVNRSPRLIIGVHLACHRQSSGHLRNNNVPGRGAAAEEIQNLPACHSEVFRRRAGKERRRRVRGDNLR